MYVIDVLYGGMIMYNFEVFRNKTLICVGGTYDNLNTLGKKASSICKERNATHYCVFKIVDGERFYFDTVLLGRGN